MSTFPELMNIFSVDRPNGSRALAATRQKICAWLEGRVPYQLQAFSLFPYYGELLGLWLITSQLLLVWAIWQQWGWGVSLIGAVSLVVILLELNGRYTITRLIRQKGYNIVLSFPAAARPCQQVILSAHYDSKTELLDHQKRKPFVIYAPVGLLIIVGLTIYGLFQARLANQAVVHTVALIVALVHWGMMAGLALNGMLGRLSQPSLGAVDNGGSCAVLLNLAQQFPTLQQTDVTMALFVGEEIWMQGSRAFVAEHDFSLPTVALNLEGMGQNGRYFVAHKIGLPLFQELSAAETLNAQLSAVITDIAKAPVVAEIEPMMTDTFPFLKKGIAGTTIGTLDRELGLSGLHRPTDNLDRIHEQKLAEAVEILQSWLQIHDSQNSLDSA